MVELTGMTTQEARTELIKVAAEMVRGLHGEDIVFSKTTPWYIRHRVEKVIDAADERAKVLAMRLKKVADSLSIPQSSTSGTALAPRLGETAEAGHLTEQREENHG